MAELKAMAGVTAGHESGSASETSQFACNISAFLDRVEYRRCDRGDDLEDIYRLRYKSYRLSDMVSDLPAQAIHDALDETPNCHRFGVYVDGDLISTLRIHHASWNNPLSPSVMVYGDLLRPRMAAGTSFVDCSRFAVDPEWSRVYPQIPYITIRLAGIACSYFGAPCGLSTIRKEHGGFYKRIYASEQIGEERSYPGLNYPVVLYQTTVEAIRERSLQRYPFFMSTPLEQRLLFGKPSEGELAPLTVLPSARYTTRAA